MILMSNGFLWDGKKIAYSRIKISDMESGLCNKMKKMVSF